MKHQRTSSDAVAAQRGIAAIEFAMMVVLLLVIAFGLVSYGVMFWAKQDLSQLAGEGARYALTASMTGTDNVGFTQQGCQHVTSLLPDGLLQKEGLTCAAAGGAGTGGSGGVPCLWASSLSPGDPQPLCATITLSYDVKKLPLAGLVGDFAGFFSANASDWVPATLTASSTVQLVTNDG